MTDFDTAFETFVAGCQKICDDDHARMGYHKFMKVEISVDPNGRKFKKVVRSDVNGTSRSVHCFVDTTNGDVLKAASWKTPAKHARGNIFAADNGLDCMGPYGAAYMR